MKNFKIEFSILKMLSNKKITGTISTEEFTINYPTLHTLENLSVNFLMDFLEEDISKIGDMLVDYKFNSHYKLICFLLTVKNRSEDVERISKLLYDGFKYFIPDFEFEKNFMKIKDIHVEEEMFDRIVEILFLMFDKKRIVIYETDDEFTKREKEMQIRAKKIRENSKKGKAQGNALENTLAGILYEFPQYKLEELFDLNLYTIYYLFGYVGKIANYEVSKIATGNGITKKGKHKHFIE